MTHGPAACLTPLPVRPHKKGLSGKIKTFASRTVQVSEGEDPKMDTLELGGEVALNAGKGVFPGRNQGWPPLLSLRHPVEPLGRSRLSQRLSSGEMEASLQVVLIHRRGGSWPRASSGRGKAIRSALESGQGACSRSNGRQLLSWLLHPHVPTILRWVNS